jgi:MarR family transcriptional regulator, transcriptional regulator for hemolysin
LDLDRSFGFLVNDVARLFGRRFSQNGHRLGLTRAQCRTLARIARHEGINQAGLADLLEVRPMTLVRQIDRMEDAGWIERRPDPADRRARKLFLTDKARPILGRIRNVANETRDEALARLSPPERAQLVALLTRVHATLSARVPPDAPNVSETRDAEDERETVAIPPRHTPRRPAIAQPPREAEGAVPAVEVTR